MTKTFSISLLSIFPLRLLSPDSLTPAVEGFTEPLFTTELNNCACRGSTDVITTEKSKSSCNSALVPTSKECHNGQIISQTKMSGTTLCLCPLYYLTSIPSFPTAQHLTLISWLHSSYITVMRLYRG